MQDKGMMGIGALIIFIAVILVAAVAAAVLVATSSNLQQRAILTGSQTEEAIVTGVEVISVMATDGSQNSDIETFELLVRLQAGSDPMNLNNTVILVDTADDSLSLSYNGSVESTDPETASNTERYHVFAVKSGPDYEDNYVGRGDLIKLVFKCYDCTTGDTGGIIENKKVRIKIIPRVGSTTLIEFTTPDVIIDKRVSLWP